MNLTQPFAAIADFVTLGGPVVAVLLVMSVVALAAVIAKLVQFAALGVGRHRRIRAALALCDAGETGRAMHHAAHMRGHLAPLLREAVAAGHDPAARERLLVEADGLLARLERGFRLLDSIAQLAPLLGLFGTVLGMIDAFRSLQEAGSSVDPSLLAGGIWVALMTTAAGLGVAMPTSVLLTWFESRVARERLMADTIVEVALSTRGSRTDAAWPEPARSEPSRPVPLRADHG